MLLSAPRFPAIRSNSIILPRPIYRMSRRKRTSQAAELDEDEVEILVAAAATTASAPVTINIHPDPTTKAGNFQASPKEMEKFHKISADAQAQCVKSVVRLFIMRGARKDTISRTTVQDVLGKVDPAYKKLYPAVLMLAHAELKKVFGINLVNSDDILGMKEPKKDDFYLISNSNSLKLRLLLAKSDKSGAFYGFMLLVLHSILMAPGQKLACRDILNSVRQLEPRFPLDLVVSKGSSALAVPELGDDFLGLIGRMKKEQYLVAAKDEVDGSDVSKMIYSFGPRFFVEMGKKQLVVAYFSLLGQPVDNSILRDIEQDVPEEEEEGGEGVR